VGRREVKTFGKRPNSRDTYRGNEGQKEGHEGNMKVVQTDRFPFIPFLRILRTLSDLCDLCVSLWFARVASADDDAVTSDSGMVLILDFLILHLTGLSFLT